MRRQYFRFSALLAAALLVGSLGVTPALADEAKPVDIKFQGTSVKHRATFEISFSGFARFFRMAYQRASDFTPITAPPPSAFDPGDENLIFWLGKPGHKNDPNEVPSSPKVIDDANPI